MRHIVKVVFLACSVLSGTEYFLGTGGRDRNPGTSEERPWSSIGHAVRKLKAGDTLTILPGEYPQETQWEFAGEADKPTVVRAKIPGTVHFRGDEPAGDFIAAPGVAKVYFRTVPRMPQAVLERDTLTRYDMVPSLREVAARPGSSWFDRKNNQVYIQTTDGAHPALHDVTFSVRRGDAFRVTAARKVKDGKVRNLHFEGLTFSGYHSATPMAGGRSTFGGIYLLNPEKCSIKKCDVHLSGGGLTLTRPTDVLVEDGKFLFNGTDFNGSGGNVICYNPTLRTTIRRCLAVGSPHSGIRMYGGIPAEESLIEDCVAYDNSYGDIWIKYPSDTSVVRRCFASNAIHSRKTENSIFTSGDEYYFGRAGDSIARSRTKFQPDAEFSDPSAFDFRLQEKSQFRGNPDSGISGFDPSVLFVSPRGDDKASGRGIAGALKTLRAATEKCVDGGTIYLLPGTYPEKLTLSGKKNILIRGRGNVPPVLTGGAEFRQTPGLRLENLNFTQAPLFDGCDGLSLRNCGVRDDVSFSGKGVKLFHNAFAGAVKFRSPDGEMRANIFGKTLDSDAAIRVANAYAGAVPDGEILSFTAIPEFSDAADGKFFLKNARLFDGRAVDGMPVGPFRRSPVRSEGECAAEMLSSTPTTANFLFTAPGVSTAELRWGADGKKNGGKKTTCLPGVRHVLSASGVKPGTRLFAGLSASVTRPVRFTGAEPVAPTFGFSRNWEIQLPEKSEPRTFHVAPSGDNSNDGSSKERAWKEIGFGAGKVRAGDTLLIHDGRYQETVVVEGTGDKGVPITIAAAPGAKVWIDGAGRTLVRGIVIDGKNEVVIDGLRFSSFLSQGWPCGAVVVLNSDGVKLRRCFYDGRGSGYGPCFITASGCRSMLMENCVILRGFHGFSFSSCPDLEVKNCVFVRNQVNHGTLGNSLSAKAHFHHNIWAGHELQKVGNPVLRVSEVTTFRENDNCFLVRLPAESKPLFGVDYAAGKKLEQNELHPLLTQEWKRQGRFGNDQRPYDDFCRRYQRTPTALFVDPKMKGLPTFTRFATPEEWLATYTKSAVATPCNRIELNYEKGKPRELDFSDYFAQDPEVKRRGVGLRPEAFTGR